MKAFSIGLCCLALWIYGNPAIPGFAEWKTAYGVTESSTDGDPWTLLQEYLLGLDPTVKDGAEAFQIGPYTGGSLLHIDFWKATAPTHLQGVLERSADLEHWASASLIDGGSLAETAERKRLRRSVPVDKASSAFFRMRTEGYPMRFSRSFAVEALPRRVTGGASTIVADAEADRRYVTFMPDQIGDALFVDFPALTSGRYRVQLRYHAKSGGGTARIWFNGEDTGVVVDQDGEAGIVELDLGLQRLDRDGEQALRLVSWDGNPITLEEVTFLHRPNILIIYSDDHNREDVGVYGGDVLTPAMNRLAAGGMRFTQYHVASPVCTPSRFTLLTGRHASRSLGFQQRFPTSGYPNIGWNTQLYQNGVIETETLPQKLQGAGYRTALVGKWHLGGPPNNTLYRLGADFSAAANPEDPDWETTETMLQANQEAYQEAARACGFDYVATALRGNVDDGWRPDFNQKHNQEWITKGALAFLDEHGDEPFFLYVPTTLTHSPNNLTSLQTEDRVLPFAYLEEPEEQADLEALRAAQPSRQSVIDRVDAGGYSTEPQSYGTTWLDDGIGAILDRLETLGLEEDTIVFFASDHGVRPGKFSGYDHGARVPFIVRWPRKFQPGQVCNQLATNMDIAATIYDICGLPLPQENVLDGQSLVSALVQDGTYERPYLMLEITSERTIVTADGYKYMAVRFPPDIQAKVDGGMRHTHWQIPEFPEEERRQTHNAEYDYAHYWDQDQLYDLNLDPDEQNNVYEDPTYAEVRARLRELLTIYSSRLPHKFGEFSP